MTISLFYIFIYHF